MAKKTQSQNGDQQAIQERVAASLSTAMEELRNLWGLTQAEPAPANQESPAPATRARGTRDITQQAKAAAAEPTLRDKVELILRNASMDIQALSRSLRQPAARVSAIVREAVKAGNVANVGTEDSPVWTWRIGDNTSSAELVSTVRRLISERPMTTRDIAHATGARFTRAGGAVVAIQRSGEKILNLGHGRMGRWFLLTDQARDARLAPKKP